MGLERETEEQIYKLAKLLGAKITFINVKTGVIEFECNNLRAFALAAGVILDDYKKKKGGVH